MENRSPPALYREVFRTLFKKHLAIGYGDSNVAIEARLRSACSKALHFFGPEDSLALCSGNDIPWFSVEKLNEMTAAIKEPPAADVILPEAEVSPAPPRH